VLEYGSTENCQFGAKTDRNSIFLVHDPRIVNRLSITVSYFNFYGFWKISHFCLKSMGVSLRFDRKLPVRGKNWSKLRISWSWPRIANWLSITVPYFNFQGFWKFSHFCSKSIGVSLRFDQKLPVRGKNWSKLRISWSWPPYCESVIYNGPVFQFLLVLKIVTFLLKIQMC
jgi:intracellular septation protein A